MLEGRLDGHPIKVLDVSFGGIGGAIEIVGHGDYQAPADENLRLEIEIGKDQTLIFEVIIVRLMEPAGTFGAQFVSLSDEQFRVLEKLTMGRPL